MKTQFKFPMKSFGLIAMMMIAILAYNPMYAQTQTTATSTQSNQEITVKGTVNDENGPLLGASITLKNSKIGTVSDENGAFTFPKALQPGDVLVFSFLGYEMKEIKIQKNTSFLKVVLETDIVEILGALESNEPYKSKRSN
ncbi:carboxypeptidase-like regulatory domain-containing protein [Psychroserpens algicola]|uniref:Carboxypeptidase-like regulatory domain-containing protein n=1 Tax=Psychroserpens algicola TaxID=1719034 RepID=A0ABT0H4T1_9FLAO|nr:carboxypeptidase-like regulatory domain-containing protein [Psychroserpens algicola]MCK8479398.1 carboxypeptidase-like regulatory domain-containing protein [Psychroserpens algicola]